MLKNRANVFCVLGVLIFYRQTLSNNATPSLWDYFLPADYFTRGALVNLLIDRMRELIAVKEHVVPLCTDATCNDAFIVNESANILFSPLLGTKVE